ncbi:MAG: hypothetical protein J6D45_07980 [Clostridia bacterium]|nr:hypothetical protein [Clostridia bacterium]
MLYLYFFLTILIFVIPPIVLTIMNIFYLIKDRRRSKKPDNEDASAKTTQEPAAGEAEIKDQTDPIAVFESREEKMSRRRMGVDVLIFLLGITYTVILWAILPLCEWDNAVLYLSDHMSLAYTFYTPISAAYLPTVLTLVCIAIVGFWVLRLSEAKLPPLVSAFCFSSLFIGFVLSLVWTVQILPGYNSFAMPMFLLFPLNYCICSVRLLRNILPTICQKISDTEYKAPILVKCKGFLSRAHGFILFSFVLAFPLTILAVVIMILFGQAPDSVIKAFTETAEWTLSQKIPPPRINSQGHYLCTVAACGDEKTVKPLRAGKRHGRLIVVNRQLLVANAFEDLIKERTPKLHRLIRGIYDKYGIPISKHITTKRRSNAVYFLMKPLEWLFVLVLYTFDLSPEDRIATQYTK